MIGAVVTASLAILVAASVALAQAEGGPTIEEAAVPIALVIQVGKSASICPCPVSRVICDDPGLIEIVDAENDVRLKGVRPGTTHCSATNGAGFRVFYDVTVVAAPE